MRLSRRKLRELSPPYPFLLAMLSRLDVCPPLYLHDLAHLLLRKVTNVLYPCAVLLSQALCDVSRIGALGLSSFLAHFAYGHIHTALFNCQRTVICGGSYQICGIHYGVVFKLRMTEIIPSSSSQREGTKGAMILKFSKRDLIPSLIQRKN